MEDNLSSNLKLTSLLSSIEARIDQGDCFFLHASRNGQVKIVENLTDFGDAVYLEIGQGEKKDLMKKASLFITERAYKKLQASEKLEKVLAKNFRIA